MPVGRSLYVALLDTVEPVFVGNDSSSPPTQWRVAVENRRNSVRFWLELHLLAGRTVRFRLTEANPLRPRFEPPVGDVLVGEPRPTPHSASIERAADGSSVTLRVRPSANGAPDVSLRVLADPLRIDVLQAGELVLVANARGLLRFEHTRTQAEAAGAGIAATGEQPASKPSEGADGTGILGGARGLLNKWLFEPLGYAFGVSEAEPEVPEAPPVNDEGKTDEELADELLPEKDDSDMIYGEDGKLHSRNEKHDETLAEGASQPAEKPAEEKSAEEKDLQFKPVPVEAPAAQPSNLEPAATSSDTNSLDDIDNIDTGPEHFKTHTDSKPYGPTSVGMDFTFVNFQHVYGIPEHADSFSLKSTTGGDPYRLFNLDVFEYDLDSPMALYGSVPYMIAHSARRSAGLFWLNPSETWIDIEHAAGGAGGVLSTLWGSLTGAKTSGSASAAPLPDAAESDAARASAELSAAPNVHTHWFSEAGIVDVFVLLGPQPRDLFQQYAALTGTTQLPPLSMLGYHQCRWNYNDEQDVKSVDAQMDEHDIPFDVIWLDIEYTDGKRYFTWDTNKFPKPEAMLGALVAKGRNLVTIIDPHLKVDTGYAVYREARDRDLLVKSKDRQNFEGWCWPGTSAYLDYLKPEVRYWWAQQFTAKASAPMAGITDTHLYIWNDMNEPSVFNGPEISMHRDNLHRTGGRSIPGPYGFFASLSSKLGGGGAPDAAADSKELEVSPEQWWEHREVHNLYGFYTHMATQLGQLLRGDYKERTFVLTRSFFAGSQRFAAMWTGDNKAEWGHLRITVPMLLSVSVAGVSFAGADVGGFFGNPDTELQVRWYQAGAWQPFFRAHAHIDTRRREPYLLAADLRAIVRQAIRTRQSYLPTLYTLFYENELHGVPVMRPLWTEFPTDTSTFAIDDQYLIGPSLLVRPVLEAGQSSVEIYFPQSAHDIWWDLNTFKTFPGGSRLKYEVTMSTVPVFQRGGTIVVRKERIRRATWLTRFDPFSIWIALDRQKSAKGTIYVDDYHSFNYKTSKEFGYYQLQFVNNRLDCISLDKDAHYKSTETIERIVLLGYPNKPTTVTLKSESGTRNLPFGFMEERKILVVRKPDVSPVSTWSLEIN